MDNYGEGAIFGCPAHDERDYEFASKYNIPIIKVIDCDDNQLPYTQDGTVVNSPLLNGLKKSDAIDKIIEYLQKNKKHLIFDLPSWSQSNQVLNYSKV